MQIAPERRWTQPYEILSTPRIRNCIFLKSSTLIDNISQPRIAAIWTRTFVFIVISRYKNFINPFLNPSLAIVIRLAPFLAIWD